MLRRAGHGDPILDVRAQDAFLSSHAPAAVNIPIEELTRRMHELPPKGSEIRLFHDDPDRLAAAALMLKERGYTVREPALRPADLTHMGPSRGRLWRPSPFLMEATDAVNALAPPGAGAARRRALDLACGTGREAVFLALAGWDVDAIDVLPDALARADDLARRSGVTIRTIRQDLRRQTSLPREAYDLVTVFRFLHRPLLPAIAGAVAPGGFLVYETFHVSDAKAGRSTSLTAGRSTSLTAGRSTSLTAGSSASLTAGGTADAPARALADGELPAAFAGFDILIARDGEAREGRAFSQLLARKAFVVTP